MPAHRSVCPLQATEAQAVRTRQGPAGRPREPCPSRLQPCDPRESGPVPKQPCAPAALRGPRCHGCGGAGPRAGRGLSHASSRRGLTAPGTRACARLSVVTQPGGEVGPGAMDSPAGPAPPISVNEVLLGHRSPPHVHAPVAAFLGRRLCGPVSLAPHRDRRTPVSPAPARSRQQEALQPGRPRPRHCLAARDRDRLWAQGAKAGLSSTPLGEAT